MSFLDTMQTRQLQKKANNFVKVLQKKTNEKEVEQLYLDNREFENNEIVLSYLFFNYPSLIRILPADFQVSRINSNLSMFKYGSSEVKKKLASLWIKDNKFFMNANVVGFSDDEYDEYVKLYFNQPEDLAKLYMEDITNALEVLVSIDLKESENMILSNKDNLTDRQWEFVIKAYAPFIKYASQNVQDKYSDDEKYNKYINSEARDIFINNEIDKIKQDFSLFENSPIDVKCNYIMEYPYMINNVSNEGIIELLKYDFDLVRYVNMPSLRNSNEDGDILFWNLFNNIETKSSKEIVDIFVSKGLFNARGKLYRFNKKSNDVSYQYTDKMLHIIQKLNIDQIISLIMIDVNYVLPYIVPLYHYNDSVKDKEKVIIDSNSRCLNLFKAYYSSEIYDNYYKVINKIYNEVLSNMDKYYYETDYDSVFDLFKILFNKSLINENKVERITVFIGMTLLYKSSNKNSEKVSISLLNDILKNGYKNDFINNESLYDIKSLEVYDDRLSFINRDLLFDYFNSNFANISSLLFIVKSKKIIKYFKKYYSIVTLLYGEGKEILFRCVENFQYYLPLLRDLDKNELSEKDFDNLIELFSSFGNYCNITKYEELTSYGITLLKKLIKNLSSCSSEDAYKNLICNYLFCMGYNKKGNCGLLDVDTIGCICNTYSSELLREFSIDGNRIFSEEECNFFDMIVLLFNSDDEILIEYIDNFISQRFSNKINRNIPSIIDFFSKFKKYRVDLLNYSLVTLDDIEEYSLERPESISKEYISEVCVYNIYNQRFQVLCSLKEDSSSYCFCDINSLNYNSYGFDSLNKNLSFRFSDDEGKTIIKINNDYYSDAKMEPSYIIAFDKISDNLLNNAKKRSLPIILLHNEEFTNI